jgi:hypothetical protein
MKKTKITSLPIFASDPNACTEPTSGEYIEGMNIEKGVKTRKEINYVLNKYSQKLHDIYSRVIYPFSAAKMSTNTGYGPQSIFYYMNEYPPNGLSFDSLELAHHYYGITNISTYIPKGTYKIQAEVSWGNAIYLTTMVALGYFIDIAGTKSNGDIFHIVQGEGGKGSTWGEISVKPNEIGTMIFPKYMTPDVIVTLDEPCQSLFIRIEPFYYDNGKPRCFLVSGNVMFTKVNSY